VTFKLIRGRPAIARKLSNLLGFEVTAVDVRNWAALKKSPLPVFRMQLPGHERSIHAADPEALKGWVANTRIVSNVEGVSRKAG
jgi:hypothetical protein